MGTNSQVDGAKDNKRRGRRKEGVWWIDREGRVKGIVILYEIYKSGDHELGLDLGSVLIQPSM